MRILVSNDDGIYAPGLRDLVAALADLGEILVAAPDRARSASGHSITLHKPLRADPVQIAGAAAAYSISGTPTDCVALALRRLFKEPPDLLISGINHGANLGWDLTYSGTVAAAVEGALLGTPAIAISLASRNPEQTYHHAAACARRLAIRIQKDPLPPFTLLNVNVPWTGDEPPLGIRVTRQGKRRYDGGVVERQDPSGRPYYWLGGEIPEEELSPGTDTRAIIDGYTSVTPIHLDLTAVELLPHVRSWGLEDERY
ncbi:MAG: 5'/3'-nucleotidase SurE [Armatimonadota bacterium]|nr:5'/3'-nucleotidase SurE [Armatimonadota bacterium]